MEIKAFGKYQILEQIGKGGFGEVYKGRDPMLNRFVAVKTCSSHDEELRKRFFREAEIAANLQHPAIVTVFDFGHQQGTPYLVQEYLRGEDLDRKIARRDPLPDDTKIGYLRQIAAGLDYAHSRDVIHRDVKPANVRVLDDGQAHPARVKIMDFGIAKVLSEEHGLTRTGTALGTAAYMPPEQLRGEKVDRRGDLFSFGCLAYELLTYARPFAGDSLSAVLFAIAHRDPPPVASLWPACPPHLAVMIDRCLRKDPAERYAGFADVLAVLEGAPQGASTALPPPPPPPPPPPAAAVPPPVPTDAATLREATVPVTERTAPEPPPAAVPAAAPAPPAPAPAAKKPRRWRALAAAAAVGCAAVALVTVLGLLWLARQARWRAAEAPSQTEVASAEAAEPRSADSELTEPEAPRSATEAEPPAAETPRAVPDEPPPTTVNARPPPEPAAPAEKEELAAPPKGVRPTVASPPPAEPAPAVVTPQPATPPAAAPQPATPQPAAPRPAAPLVSASYGVVLGLLAPGERVYADRDYVYQTVPAAFLRLTCLRTFQDRKLARGLFSFTANRAVEVFVAHDQRIKRKPGWLREFRKTGQVLTVNEGEGKEIAYAIYVKPFNPGVVRLGPNVAPRAGKRSVSMYVVFVRPR